MYGFFPALTWRSQAGMTKMGETYLPPPYGGSSYGGYPFGDEDRADIDDISSEIPEMTLI